MGHSLVDPIHNNLLRLVPVLELSIYSWYDACTAVNRLCPISLCIVKTIKNAKYPIVTRSPSRSPSRSSKHLRLSCQGVWWYMSSVVNVKRTQCKKNNKLCTHSYRTARKPNLLSIFRIITYTKKQRNAPHNRSARTQVHSNLDASHRTNGKSKYATPTNTSPITTVPICVYTQCTRAFKRYFIIRAWKEKMHTLKKLMTTRKLMLCGEEREKISSLPLSR